MRALLLCLLLPVSAALAQVSVSGSGIYVGPMSRFDAAPSAGSFDFTNMSFTGVASAAQGAKADTALQPAALVSYATTAALTSGLSGKMAANPGGSAAQYMRGDGTMSTFPTAVSSFTNDAAYVNQAGSRAAISLTITGTSGAATYNSSTGVLNVPQYTGGSGTVTGITAGTGLTGGTITTSGTIGLVARSFNNAASITLVTSPTGQGGTVIDASRDAFVTYSVATSTTATIGGASSVTVLLEIATTNSATASDWTAIQTVSNSQTITLAVALQSVQANTLTMSGVVPAGYYRRVRYAVTGTASASYVNGQEVKA